MNPALLTEKDLFAWTGYSRRSDLDRLLRKHGVRVIYGRDGGICTTLDCLNAAMIGKNSQAAPTPEFE